MFVVHFLRRIIEILIRSKRRGKLRWKKNGGQSYQGEMIVSLAKFLSFADELCFPTLAFPSIIKGNDTTGHSFHGSLSFSVFGFQSVHGKSRVVGVEGRARPLHNS